MKTFYLEVDNSWDAHSEGNNELEAVKAQFPGSEPKYLGADSDESGDYLIYEVYSDGEWMEVKVSELK
jgi:hypothetical protein